MKIKSVIENIFLFNNIDFYPDAVIVVDELNNITHWSKKAADIFGYRKNEMIGRNAAILFDTQTEKLLESAELKKTIVLSSKNNFGESVFVELSCKFCCSAQKIMMTARDVTKNQKLIEKFLIEYETATKINNNKNKFIVGLSSDLKTPLHSLIGFSQGLLDGVCGGLSDKQAKYVAIINKNANNLLEVVENLLELSGLESGNADLNLKVFDLHKTINLVCSKIKEHAETKGIHFESDLNDLVKKNIYSDENMFYRILFSILENAVKLTEVGNVKLKIHHPDIGIFKTQGLEIPAEFNDKAYLLVMVTDTGAGLTEEETAVIFDEYSQTDRNLARKFGGTGLKLALTRKMITSLGGTIWVESEHTQGSTFSFIIPIEKPVQQASPIEE